MADLDYDTLTLTEILVLRCDCLVEHELIALCRECCLLLEYIEDTPEMFQAVSLIPDTIGLDPTGNVCFLDAEDEPEPLFLPPEYDEGSKTFKSHLYSLGMTMLFASRYNGTSQSDIIPSPSKDSTPHKGRISGALSRLLGRMTTDDVADRPELRQVILDCDELLKGDNSQDVCQAIVDSAYAKSTDGQAIPKPPEFMSFSPLKTLSGENLIANSSDLHDNGVIADLSSTGDSIGSPAISSQSDPMDESLSDLLGKYTSHSNDLIQKCNPRSPSEKTLNMSMSASSHTGADNVEMFSEEFSNNGVPDAPPTGGDTNNNDITSTPMMIKSKMRVSSAGPMQTGASLGVTLSETLDRRDSYFEEAELCAVCKEAILTLKQLKKRLPAYISPDTVVVREEGFITFKAIPEGKPLEVIFMAPELQQRGILSEKTCLYGLGVTLRCAMGQKNISSSQKLPISGEFEKLLSSMIESNHDLRPSIAEALKVCSNNESLTDVPSYAICQFLFQDTAAAMMESDAENDHHEDKSQSLISNDIVNNANQASIKADPHTERLSGHQRDVMTSPSNTSTAINSAFKPIHTSSFQNSNSAFKPITGDPSPLSNSSDSPLSDSPTKIPSAYMSTATHFRPIILQQGTQINGKDTAALAGMNNAKETDVVRKLKDLKKNLMKNRTLTKDGVTAVERKNSSDLTQAGVGSITESSSDKDRPSIAPKQADTSAIQLSTMPGENSTISPQPAQKAVPATHDLEDLLKELHKQGKLQQFQMLASAISQYMQQPTSFQGTNNAPALAAGGQAYPIVPQDQLIQSSNPTCPPQPVTPEAINGPSPTIPVRHGQEMLAEVISNQQHDRVSATTSGTLSDNTQTEQDLQDCGRQPVSVDASFSVHKQVAQYENAVTSRHNTHSFEYRNKLPHPGRPEKTEKHTSGALLTNRVSLPYDSTTQKMSVKSAMDDSVHRAKSVDMTGQAMGSSNDNLLVQRVCLSQKPPPLLCKILNDSQSMPADVRDAENVSTETACSEHNIPISDLDTRENLDDTSEIIFSDIATKHAFEHQQQLKLQESTQSLSHLKPKSPQGIIANVPVTDIKPIIPAASRANKVRALSNSQSSSPSPSKDSGVSGLLNIKTTAPSSGQYGNADISLMERLLSSDNGRQQQILKHVIALIRDILVDCDSAIEPDLEEYVIGEYVTSLSGLKWETFVSAVREKYTQIYWPDELLAQLFEAIHKPVNSTRYSGSSCEERQDTPDNDMGYRHIINVQPANSSSGSECRCPSGGNQARRSGNQTARQSISSSISDHKSDSATPGRPFSYSSQPVLGPHRPTSAHLYSCAHSNCSDSTDSEQRERKRRLKKRHELDKTKTPLYTTTSDSSAAFTAHACNSQVRSLSLKDSNQQKLELVHNSGQRQTPSLQRNTWHEPGQLYQNSCQEPGQLKHQCLAQTGQNLNDSTSQINLSSIDITSDNLRDIRLTPDSQSQANITSSTPYSGNKSHLSSVFQSTGQADHASSNKDIAMKLDFELDDSFTNNSCDVSNSDDISCSPALEKSFDNIIKCTSPLKSSDVHLSLTNLNSSSLSNGHSASLSNGHNATLHGSLGNLANGLHKLHIAPDASETQSEKQLSSTYTKCSNVVYHSAELQYCETVQLHQLVQELDPKNKMNLEKKKAQVDQQIMMERKMKRKTLKLYTQLIEGGSKVLKNDNKGVMTQVSKDVVEMTNRLKFLHVVKGHVEMLIAELYGINPSRLHSLVECPFNCPLRLTPRTDTPLLQFQVFRDTGAGVDVKILHAGTPEGLMSYLFAMSALADGYVHQFLFCFRYFVSQHTLLDFIISRFGTARMNPNGPQNDRIVRRAVDLLCFWLEGYYTVDFDKDPDLIDKLHEFSNKQVAFPDDALQSLKDLLTECQHGQNLELSFTGGVEEEDINLNIKVQKPFSPRKWESFRAILAKKPTSPKVKISQTGTAMTLDRNQIRRNLDDIYFPRVMRRTDAFTLVDYEVKNIAEQLTLIEQELFQSTHPIHYLNSKAQGIGVAMAMPSLLTKSPQQIARTSVYDENASLSSLFIAPFLLDPSIQRILDHSKDVSHWVSSEILSCSSVKSQLAVLSKFLQTAQRCMQMRNFASCISIVDGLENLIVRQLPLWRSLPNKCLNIMEELSSLKMLLKNEALCMSQDKDFRCHPTIPSVLIFLLHIQQLEIGGFRLANGMYKWAKMRAIAQALDQIRMFRDRMYNYDPHYDLQDMLHQRIHEFRKLDLQAIAVQHDNNYHKVSRNGIQGALRKMKDKLQARGDK